MPVLTKQRTLGTE